MISSKLVILNLSFNNLGNESIDIISNSLSKSSSLLSLDLSSNNIQSEGASNLFKSLLNSSTITHLNISNNGETQKNHIGIKGAISLKYLLENNCILSILNIADNLIGNDGFQIICGGLDFNNSIISLDISNNNLSNNTFFNLCIHK